MPPRENEQAMPDPIEDSRQTRSFPVGFFIALAVGMLGICVWSAFLPADVWLTCSSGNISPMQFEIRSRHIKAITGIGFDSNRGETLWSIRLFSTSWSGEFKYGE